MMLGPVLFHFTSAADQCGATEAWPGTFKLPGASWNFHFQPCLTTNIINSLSLPDSTPEVQHSDVTRGATQCAPPSMLVPALASPAQTSSLATTILFRQRTELVQVLTKRTTLTLIACAPAATAVTVAAATTIMMVVVLLIRLRVLVETAPDSLASVLIFFTRTSISMV